MKNTIKVTIPFSFKGIEHSPSSIIDLDLFIQGGQTLDNAYQLIANENKIDNFSYEFEVLESSPKIFSDPTGLAVNFISETHFDLEGFKKQFVDSDTVKKLQAIAHKLLTIDDLDAHEDIKQALIEAYKAGKNSV